MTDKTLPTLSASAAVQGTDLFLSNQDGLTDTKTTAAQLLTYINANAAVTLATIANEASDTTCFPLFATAATGNLGPKSNTALIFNSATGALGASAFVPSGTTVPKNGIYLPAANTLGFAVNSAAEMSLTATALSPTTSDGNALGTTALMWSDLFLASGGVVNFNNGDVAITHSSNTLAFTGAASDYTFDARNRIVAARTDVTASTLLDAAGASYQSFDWQPAADSAVVRFASISYAQHSTNNSITGIGHYGASLMFAQKTGTGTDALVIGGEGRVGAIAGTITIGAALVATFDTNGEDGGTIEYGAGLYIPDQSDDAHITNKYAVWNNDSGWQIRSQGPINARGTLQQRDRNVEGSTAWVHFDATGGTPTIRGSFNVTSITDGGVGAYTVNLTNALTGSGDKSCNATAGGAALTVACMDADLSSNSAFNVYTYSLLSLTIADGPVSMTIHGGTQ